MDATLLGIIALVAGVLWKAFPALQKWIPADFWKKLPTPPAPPVPQPEDEAVKEEPVIIGRLEALKHAEKVLQYLEQNDLEDGQDALREVVAILFSTPDKE